MTNSRLSGTSSEAIENAFRLAGVKQVRILGYEAICELLTEHKALRALVPRLYGLGDLTEILDDRAYEQPEAILALTHDQLARLVPVAAHRTAHLALRGPPSTFPLGEAGAGKSPMT